MSLWKRRRGTAAILSALLLLAPLAAPAAAQTESPGYRVDTRHVDRTWEPQTQIVDGKVEMTMWQAIEVALRRNYSLVIERYNLEESALRLTENMGIYDLGITTDLTGFTETTPAASNLDGAAVQEQENVRWISASTSSTALAGRSVSTSKTPVSSRTRSSRRSIPATGSTWTPPTSSRCCVISASWPRNDD